MTSGPTAYQRYVSLMDAVLLGRHEALLGLAQSALEEAAFTDLDPRALAELAGEGCLAGTRDHAGDAQRMAQPLWYLYRLGDHRCARMIGHLASWHPEVLEGLEQRSKMTLRGPA